MDEWLIITFGILFIGPTTRPDSQLNDFLDDELRTFLIRDCKFEKTLKIYDKRFQLGKSIVLLNL